jgi:hypothetical protein
MKICMLVGCIIDYVCIYFYNFLKLRKLILIFLHEEITRASSGVKNTFRITDTLLSFKIIWII